MAWVQRNSLEDERISLSKTTKVRCGAARAAKKNLAGLARTVNTQAGSDMPSHRGPAMLLNLTVNVNARELARRSITVPRLAKSCIALTGKIL